MPTLAIFAIEPRSHRCYALPTVELLDPTAPLPLLTDDLPGTGGAIKTEPDDFRVEEILGREPAGRGEHLLLWLEKRTTSAEAIEAQVARALEITPREVGTAGLKDTHAVTRQWVSVPVAAEARVAAIDSDRLRVIDVNRDTGKLRAGQLEGNRFDVLIRDPHPEAMGRARAVCDRLLAVGVPGYYGPQRFGHDGHTARTGFALLRGEANPHRGGGFRKKLALSAAQSLAFNTWLAARHRDGLLLRAIDGEVLQKRNTGLPFWADDLEATQRLLDDRRVVAMGPMFGPRMRRAKREAAAREQLVLDATGLDLDAFAAFGKLCRGTRRPALVHLSRLELVDDPAGLRLRFDLPAGVYATVLLAEVMKEG